eukprot:TRINITY_DN94510_c0_g1_i1.p1 TRINITY_DN94510_c0_g1~~TRINITY_DN94510_c0_g1_i1.p1  ORF type:complete len:106 (-),score=7.10 TRINITY_DN94510_c0_g1_i1:119-436(-)
MVAASSGSVAGWLRKNSPTFGCSQVYGLDMSNDCAGKLYRDAPSLSACQQYMKQLFEANSTQHNFIGYVWDGRYNMHICYPKCALPDTHFAYPNADRTGALCGMH